jgi:hypothetical protein
MLDAPHVSQVQNMNELLRGATASFNAVAFTEQTNTIVRAASTIGMTLTGDNAISSAMKDLLLIKQNGERNNATSSQIAAMASSGAVDTQTGK